MLTAIGCGIAATTGCLGSNQSGNVNSTSDPAREPTDTETPPSVSDGKKIRVSSVEDVPKGVPLTPSVNVIHSEISADQTARVQVTCKNTSNQAIWSNARVPAFGNFISRKGSDEQRLLFLKPTQEYDVTHPDCWRADLSKYALNSVHSDVINNIRYDAGGSKSTALDMYGHPENDDPCFELGDYRMQNTYRVSDTSDLGEVQWEFQWGYTISIVES